MCATIKTSLTFMAYRAKRRVMNVSDSDPFSAAEVALWVRVVEQAKKDLVSWNTNLALKAARYFFLEPVESDRHNIRTFAGLCAATGINADAAAKMVFTGLQLLH